MLARLLVADAQINWDEELYFQIAKHWDGDILPYRDLFDHKPPALFLWFKLVSDWGESMALVRVVQTGLLLGAIFLLLIQLKARLPLLWVPLVLALLSLPAGLGTNSELVNLPMIIASLAWALNGRWVWAGVAAALAVSVKYTVALDLLGVLLVYLAIGDRRHLARLISAALITFIALQATLYLYFQAHGIDLIAETVLRNLQHADAGPVFYIPKTALAGFGVLGSIIAVRVLTSGLYGDRLLVAALIAWTLLSLLQSQVTGRQYAHYFVPVFVPLSLLAFLDWPDRSKIAPRLLSAALLVTLPSGVMALSALTYWGDHVARQNMAAHCPEGPFQYHGGYLAAYRVCDAAQPAKYFYPPFYADLHFIRVSGSGGTEWACALDRAILIETDAEFQLAETGADWCRTAPPEQAKAFSGVREALRNLLGNGE